MTASESSPRRLPPNVRVGCSSFTASGWVGAFYPEGTPPADFLRFYATRFDTVEVDATFYAAPSRAVAAGWNDKTPPGFVLSDFIAAPERVLTSFSPGSFLRSTTLS